VYQKFEKFLSVSKATFGMTPSEHKEFKNLPKQSKANLRYHMNDLELIFTMLGERMTTELSQDKNQKLWIRAKMLPKEAEKSQEMPG